MRNILGKRIFFNLNNLYKWQDVIEEEVVE